TGSAPRAPAGTNARPPPAELPPKARPDPAIVAVARTADDRHRHRGARAARSPRTGRPRGARDPPRAAPGSATADGRDPPAPAAPAPHRPRRRAAGRVRRGTRAHRDLRPRQGPELVPVAAADRRADDGRPAP